MILYLLLLIKSSMNSIKVSMQITTLTKHNSVIEHTELNKKKVILILEVYVKRISLLNLI